MGLRVFDVMDAHNTALMKKRDGKYFDLWLAPEMKGMSQYLIKDLEFAFEEGYAEGKKNADKIKELLK